MGDEALSWSLEMPMKRNGIANNARQVFRSKAALGGDFVKGNFVCRGYLCGNIVPVDGLEAGSVILDL